MIKTTELRIGNIILGDGYNTILLTISEADINLLLSDKSQPIPLTPKILISCGFGRNMTGTAWWDESEDVLIGEKDGKFYYAQWDNIQPNVDNIFELTSLHQFQNLYFALTQRELEFKGSWV